MAVPHRPAESTFAARSGPRYICWLLTTMLCASCGADSVPTERVRSTQAALNWAADGQLTPTDGTADDAFSGPVAVFGDTAIVGAPEKKVGNNEKQGAAYVFVRNGGTWAQQAKLMASDGAAYDWFGSGIAISGDTVIIGAVGAPAGQYVWEGAAYVFVRAGEAWVEQAKLTAPDANSRTEFGASVSLSGDTAIFGSHCDAFGNDERGPAYIFVRTGVDWAEQAEISPPEGEPGDFFGSSVAVDGDTALISAWGGGHDQQGVVYVYGRSGISWTQQTQLTGSDSVAYDRFGISLALSANTAVIGALEKTVGANPLQGAGYVFVRSGTSWTQQAEWTAPDGAQGNIFGGAVAVSGDTAIVGATSNAQSYPGVGAAYFFSQTGGTWVQDYELLTSTLGSYEDITSMVSVSGRTAIIALDDWYTCGTGGDTTQRCHRPKGVYVYSARANDGAPCANDSDCVHDHCVAQVCCATACDDCHLGAATCDPATGHCSNATASDGTPCASGACQQGLCIAGGGGAGGEGGSVGEGGSADARDNAGSGGSGPGAEDGGARVVESPADGSVSGGACHVGKSTSETRTSAFGAALALCVWMARRRRSTQFSSLP